MIKQRIKRKLRKLIHLLLPSLRRLGNIKSISADLSAGTLAIDVGASYFPLAHWESVRQSPSACWVAVDPNAHNLSYLKTWKQYYLSQLITFPNGLSNADGTQTLFVTNVDSGSSLLEPVINEDWLPRTDNSYFFPVKEIEVSCYSLTSLIQKSCAAYVSAPMWIKLDTQGTELSILEGLSVSYYQQNVVVVEAESSLQRFPIMSQSGKLSSLISYLESFGFELVLLNPISISTQHSSGLTSKTVLNECDAVFMLSPSFSITSRPLAHNLSLVAAYCSYCLYDEAIHHSKRILDHFFNELSDSSRFSLYKLLSILTGKQY